MRATSPSYGQIKATATPMGFDILFAIVLLLGALRGHRLGFARQMIHLSGLVLGVLFAEPLGKFLLPWFAENLAAFPRTVHQPIMFVGTCLGIWVLSVVAGSLYLKAYRQHVFGRNVPSPGDRYFGAAMGAGKAAALVALLVYGLNLLPNAVRETQPIARHYAASKSIALANAAKPVEYLLGLREVRRVQLHLAELVRYYRTSQDEPAEHPSAHADSAPPLR